MFLVVFPVGFAVCGGGFFFGFLGWRAVVFEGVFGSACPDCLAEAAVPLVEESVCGFFVFGVVWVVVEVVAYGFLEESAHRVHVDLIVFE